MGNVKKNQIDKKDIFIIIILFIFPFAFFLPILLTDGVLGAGDGIGYEAQFELIRQMMNEGELPLWNRYVAMGTSFIGDIQNKACYPLLWICIWFPRHLDFKIFYVLHISICMIAVFLLGKTYGCKNIVSLVMTLVFSFSNMVILRFNHINILCNIVWFPLIIALLNLYMEDKKKKYLLLMSIAMAIQFLAGFPQIALYCDIFIFFLFLYKAIIKKFSVKDIIKDILLLIGCYLGLSLVQMLPLIELMLQTGRNQITYEYFSGYAADFRMLFSMLTPLYWGNWGVYLNDADLEFPTDMYIGIFPLIVLIYTIVFCKKDKNVNWFIVCSGISFLLACACRNIPILGKILYSIPLIGSFRTTTRMLILFDTFLFISILIGLNYIIINNDYKRFRKISWVFLCAFILIILGTSWFVKCFTDDSIVIEHFQLQDGYYIKSLILIVIVIVISYLIELVKNTKYKHCLFCLVFGTLTFLEVYFINTDSAVDRFRITYLINAENHDMRLTSDVSEYLINNIGDYRYYVCENTWDDWANTPSGVATNQNIYGGLNSIQSYITFNNKNLLALCSTDYGMMTSNVGLQKNTNSSFISMMSVKYVVQNEMEEHREQECGEKIDNYRLCANYNDWYIYENLEVQPLIFAPSKVEVIDNADTYVIDNKCSIDFVDVAYVDSDTGLDSFEQNANNVVIDNIIQSGNAVSASVTVNGEQGFINMSQTYYPGWSVYIDGNKQKVCKVNALIQGTFVPAGEHEIVFVYEPISFYIGLCLSAIIMLIIAFVLIKCIVMDKKKSI